jgi:hypothetical protein
MGKPVKTQIEQSSSVEKWVLDVATGQIKPKVDPAAELALLAETKTKTIQAAEELYD